MSMSWIRVSDTLHIGGNGRWVLCDVRLCGVSHWYVMARDAATGAMQVIPDAKGNPTPVADVADAKARADAWQWGTHAAAPKAAS